MSRRMTSSGSTRRAVPGAGTIQPLTQPGPAPPPCGGGAVIAGPVVDAATVVEVLEVVEVVVDVEVLAVDGWSAAVVLVVAVVVSSPSPVASTTTAATARTTAAAAAATATTTRRGTRPRLTGTAGVVSSFGSLTPRG
jgi:hypothetical protein